MGQCLHLNDNGNQCQRDAEPDSNLCYLHTTGEYIDSQPPGFPIRKVVFRLVAGLLLLIFALQGYQLLKALLSR
jgi:hypothetical protein